MKRTGILTAAFLVFILCGCYAQHQPFTSGPAQPEDPSTWDFGSIKPAQVLTHTFVLKNETSQAFSIKDISTSCGCTVSRAAKTTLAPGESTSVEVTFNSKGYSGPVRQFVYVYTDRLDNPVIKFTITATITMSGG
jgi:hypothetical protein